MSPKRLTPKLLSSIRSRLGRLNGRSLLAIGGATALAFVFAMGAGAAPSPVAPLSEVLGLGGERGANVSQAAHDAKAAAQEEDTNVGAAVSTAVCEALKNTDDLPEPARDAPGHINQEQRDCIHPSDEEVTAEETDEEDAVEEESEAELQSEHPENRGALVSQAAHDAKTAAKEAGENVGAAVSTAVCEVIRDSENLPEPARGAPGHVNQQERDCIHPLDVEATGDAEVESESQGHGKQSAPGQLKKQND